LHLNANTVNIGLTDFVDILTKNTSDYKKRLSDIHENTKLPIVLVVEDIDTLINEEGGKSDIVTQMMTNFLEGVGSMPVTVITSSNYPERLSDRLIRPHRFDRIVPFDLPLPEKVVRQAFADHVVRNGLDKAFADAGLDMESVVNEYVPKMKDFTTSHVGSFIEAIRHNYEFEKQFNPDYRISADSIRTEFSTILVSTDDIRMRQDAITKWRQKLLERDGKPKMGFLGTSGPQ
ncbi:MAG: AAA family ATPase, partial [Patescibacteria group bacterium]